MKRQAADILTPTLDGVHQTDSLEFAFQKMKGLKHVTVLDDDTNIVGIISDRDFKKALVSKLNRYDAIPSKPAFKAGARVMDYMTWPVVTVSFNTSLLNVAEMMRTQKISAVLVFKDDELVGIITHEDLLLVLTDLLKQKRSFKEQVYEKIYDWAYQTPIGQLVTLLGDIGI